MYSYIDFKNEIEYGKLKEASEILKNGGIGIFPTETVYGIGADCFNEMAVKKIYEVKNRPKTKALSVLISNLSMLNQIAKNISKEEMKVMEKFFPGPLTLILEKNENVPEIVTAGKDTIGVRMPENEIALKLIEEVGRPLATPSANISNKPSGTEYNQIIDDFKDNINFFIDSGKSKIGLSSTIVKIENKKVNILREGIITKEDIENILKEV